VGAPVWPNMLNMPKSVSGNFILRGRLIELEKCAVRGSMKYVVVRGQLQTYQRSKWNDYKSHLAIDDNASTCYVSRVRHRCMWIWDNSLLSAASLSLVDSVDIFAYIFLHSSFTSGLD